MSVIEDHLIKHHLFRFRYTELNEIYWFMAIRSFALSLVTIFVPIYLYKSDYGISNIFLYYAALYLFEFIFELPAAKFIKSFGPKHSMTLSLPFMIFHIWQMLTLGVIHWSPIALALPLSFSLAFFWEGYHYDFSRSKHAKKATKEIGSTFIIMTMAGASAPLLGGLLATYVGINWLLVTVIVLLTAGAFILFKTKDENFRRGKINLKKVNFRHIKKHIVSYSGLGWETVSVMQIWPLFLFFIIASYSGIGLITSITLLVSVLVTYWVCRRADKGKRMSFIKTGSIAGAIVGVLQVFVDTVTKAFAANVGRALSQSVFKPPFDSEYYLHADEESRSEYIYVMESTVDLARMSFYIILYILSFYLPLNTLLIIGLLMGAAGSALISLMPPAKCDICQPIENKKIKLMPRPATR